MAIASREDLKQYCLRELGAPVLEINVDDDQLNDRIDQALDYWRLYHYEGIEQIYMKQKIRASELYVVETVGTTAIQEDILTGQTSGATCTVTSESTRKSSDHMILVKNVVGTFLHGETVTGGRGFTATLANPAVQLNEYDNRYIDIPDAVYGITKILNIGQASSSKNMFDLQYQLRLNDLYDLTSTSIIYYKTVMQHLDLLDFELNGPVPFRFNRTMNRLFIDMKWKTDVVLGDYILVQGYRALDPDEFSKVWNENWLKRYTTAQFKRQWGTNMKKFGGLQLPGGVTLNGQETYDEAIAEIKELEDELMRKSAPLDFFIG
jgi:hypothetical protein